MAPLIQTTQEFSMNETPHAPVPQRPDHSVAITVIIATTLVLLACIIGISVPLIIAALNIR
jgi:hypothetical protein